MQGKLQQFNADLKDEIVSPFRRRVLSPDNDVFCFRQSTSSLAMYPQELSAFDEIFAYLSSVTPTSSGPSLLSASHAEALIGILDRWPQSQLFPGTLFAVAIKWEPLLTSWGVCQCSYRPEPPCCRLLS